MSKVRPPRIAISLPRLIVALVVLVGVLGAWWAVAHNNSGAADRQAKTDQQSEAKQSAKKVSWNYNDQTGQWMASSTPPKCPDPMFAQSPFDTATATSVLYPGQYRGRNYKPHGGIAYDTSTTGNAQVVVPMDAAVNSLVRYIEADELQYKVSFVTECGIAFYFDHLFTLSPEFMKIANATPEPKVDDTRSQPFSTPYPVKAGDVIATTIGHPATQNYAFDFGVLDYRQPNEISKNTAWDAIHQTFKSSEWYGVCWFDLLPSADAKRVKALPSRDGQSGVRSDYCANPKGNTMGVNGGNPV